MSRTRIAVVGLAAALALLAAGLAGATTSSHAKASQHVNVPSKGSITFDGIWTGAEAKSFGDVITAFNKKYPEREGQLQAGRQQHPDGARDGRRRRASARHGGHRAAGLVKQFAEQGKLKPITTRRRR